MTTCPDYPHHSIPLSKGNQYEILIQWVPKSSLIAYFGISALFCYYLLSYLDLLPFTASQVLWIVIVYLTPSKIVFALDRTASEQGTELARISTSVKSKSEAMQRILGLDGSSFLTSFPRARRFSGISTAILGSKEHLPPGLGNWDNSCYQNSVIQGLASLRSLASCLENNSQELGHRGSFLTHDTLRDIIGRLNDPLNCGRKLWTPPELKSMSSWQQQDAQEYFSNVIDQLDKEIRVATKGITNDDAGLAALNFQKDEAGDMPSSVSEHQKESISRGKSKAIDHTCSVRNPLEGLLAQRVGCMRCGWTEGLSLIPFNCLTVPLGRNWEYDVRDCLDEYTTLEPIEGVECAKCTLVRTQSQLQQLLQQIDADAELENQSNTPRLTEALRGSAEARLKVIQEALREEDFSETTLSSKCHIPARNRVSSTKSRQAVIARAPKSLVIHVNRSVFDEKTGVLRKNYAEVRFPKILDLDEWCLGTRPVDEAVENWGTDPAESMIPRPGTSLETLKSQYELRAVITHYGRHENGHYICYRKYSVESFPAAVPEAVIAADGDKNRSKRWFRLSDEDVRMVSESSVLSQGGVFMLFYEHIEQTPLSAENQDDVAVRDLEINQNQSLGDEHPLVDISNTHSLPKGPNIGWIEDQNFPSAHFHPPASDLLVASTASDVSETPFSVSSNKNVLLAENSRHVTSFLQTLVLPEQNGEDVHISAGTSGSSPSTAVPIESPLTPPLFEEL